MKIPRGILLLICGLVLILQLACGASSRSDDEKVIATRVARGVQATLTTTAKRAGEATPVNNTALEPTSTATLVRESNAAPKPTTTTVARPAATATPKPTRKPQPTNTPELLFTNDNWNLAVTDADGYQGASVQLTGRIFLEPEVSADMVGFQMYTTDGLTDGNTVVVAPAGTKVNDGDYVRVVGTLTGMFEGENLFGATLRLPSILAEEVEVIDRATAIPARKTYNLDYPITQHGLTITLERVDISDSETRVYVKANNGSSNKAYLSTYDAKLVQGNKQYEPDLFNDTGLPDLPSDILPGIETEGVLVFDPTDPTTSLRLVWEGPHLDNYRLDFVPYVWDISDAMQPGAANEAYVVVGDTTVNVRSGPGTAYPVIGKAQAGQRYRIVARNEDNSWYQVDLNGKPGWVAASVVTTTGRVQDVGVVKNVAPPPPKPTPVPLAKVKPLGQELLTPSWGLKLYDVQRAKAVYYFSRAQFAQGTYIIPLVEFRNLSTGTAQPYDNLDFYLQDSAGKTYNFQPFGDAVLEAGWQFKAGHLYDDMNPGAVLGIALPFDVPATTGDVWLRIKQHPNVVMYLGNVSEMTESQ